MNAEVTEESKLRSPKALLATLRQINLFLALIAKIVQLRDSVTVKATRIRNTKIAITMQIVRNEGIENAAYFKGMNDTAIREFIAQYSPELVLN